MMKLCKWPFLGVSDHDDYDDNVDNDDNSDNGENDSLSVQMFRKMFTSCV